MKEMLPLSAELLLERNRWREEGQEGEMGWAAVGLVGGNGNGIVGILCGKGGEGEGRKSRN